MPRKAQAAPKFSKDLERKIIEGLRRGITPDPLYFSCGVWPVEVARVRASDPEFDAEVERALAEGAIVDRSELYLELLAEGWRPTQARRLASFSTNALSALCNADPNYLVKVEEANERRIDGLEAEAYRRAINGSDTLLIFLLKAERPGKYREQRGEVTAEPEDELPNADVFKLAARTAFLLAHTSQLAGSTSKVIDHASDGAKDTRTVNSGVHRDDARGAGRDRRREQGDRGEAEVDADARPAD